MRPLALREVPRPDGAATSPPAAGSSAISISIFLPSLTFMGRLSGKIKSH